MGNSSVFGNQISLSEQKKITDIHEKILLKCLNGNIELGSNVSRLWMRVWKSFLIFSLKNLIVTIWVLKIMNFS